MNRTSAKYRFIFALFLVLLSGTITCAQPDIEQKQAAAKAAYDDGIKLRQERTYRSYQLALDRFQLSAKLYEELGDKPNTGVSLLGMGLIKSLLDDSAGALLHYQQALAIFREAGLKPSEARTLNNIGRLYDELGDKQKALEFLNLALQLREGSDDKYGLANTLNSIASVYLDLGERARAIGLFERALAIQIEIDDKPAQAITLSNLGRTYEQLGDYQKALEMLGRSLNLRPAADKGGQATVLNNIGLVKASLNDARGAIESYERSLRLFTEAGFENRKATVLNNIGAAYILLNDYAKALEYNRQAVPLHQAMGDRRGEATTLSNIGFATARLGNTPSGIIELNRALVMARSVGIKDLEAIILGNLMRVYRDANRAEVAVLFGKQSVGTYQELRRAIASLDRSTQTVYLNTISGNYRFLADMLIGLGRFGEAAEVLQMLKEEEFAAFVRRDANEVKSLDLRVHLSEKEQKLVDRYTQLAGRSAEIGEQFNKLDERRRTLTRHEQTLSAEDEKLYQQLVAQVADVNAAFRLFVEKELVNEVGTDHVKKIEIDRNLQDRLRKWGDGTVALYTVISENRYRVILTTPTIQVDGKTDINAGELNKKVFAFYQALHNPDVDPRPLGKELYDILIKPVEKELTAARAKTLVWSLDGNLRYIPLAALSPDGQNYLVEKYRSVMITPKTRDHIADPNREWKALGMGISEAQTVAFPDQPDKKLEVSALPGTKAELTTIVRNEDQPKETGILAGRRFLDKDFTLANFTASLAKETPDGKRKYTVIHIASHFRLGSNWSNSFLFLGNGKLLTLEDLSNSPEINFADVELVTLSACNTAIGTVENGSEVESLADAIQSKNGRSVLATLWEVYDESTALLMGSFYRARAPGGNRTKAEAIQMAQRELINGVSKRPKTVPGPSGGSSPKFVFDPERPFAHPYYWSGFVLIGNWR